MKNQNNQRLTAILLSSIAILFSLNVAHPAFAQDAPKVMLNGTTSTPKSSGLASTRWALMSLTKKGEKVEENETPPDVEFLQNGSWTLLHYGNYMQGGKYQLSGNHLVMKYDDGSVYADSKISLAGDILTLDTGDYVYKLKYLGKVTG